MVGVAVDLQGREVVLGVGHDPVDPEHRDGVVGSGDRRRVSPGRSAPSLKNTPGPYCGRVDVAEQDRRPELSPGSGEPVYQPALRVPAQGGTCTV